MNIRTLGVDGDTTTQGVLYAAALCAQLPRESRVWAAINPRAAWSDTEYLLSAIEYLLRRVFWDGKGPEPQPIPAPGDIEGAKAKTEEQEKAQATVAALLGL